jgi:hypothetical protein
MTQRIHAVLMSSNNGRVDHHPLVASLLGQGVKHALPLGVAQSVAFSHALSHRNAALIFKGLGGLIDDTP